MSRTRIAVAVSGGVDSSFALARLIELGYYPVAVSIKMFDDEHSTEEARTVAEFFKVPFVVIDARKEFKERVINYFVKEYLSGRTPNPCVICNYQIKFKIIESKLNELNCKLIATGHYARIVKRNGKTFVAKARDREKSQEYFLAFLKEKTLEKTIFPLGELTKEEVVKNAVKIGIPFTKRGESQDVCFLQGLDYPEFVRNITKIEPRKGAIKDEYGNIIGTHDGFMNFTVGQRRGLNVPLGKRVYVSSINPLKNEVIVAEREEMMKRTLLVKLVEWKYGTGEFNLDVRIRYRNLPSPAKVVVKEDRCQVVFHEKQFAPTPGQIAVFYDGDIVVGGGFIESSD